MEQNRNSRSTSTDLWLVDFSQGYMEEKIISTIKNAGETGHFFATE